MPSNAVVFGGGPDHRHDGARQQPRVRRVKSPLTSLFFDSTFGGRFPATLKRTGFDAVAITGRAAVAVVSAR